mgnify:CR=1 FL=1
MVFEEFREGVNFFFANNTFTEIGLAFAYGVIVFLLLRFLKYAVDKREIGRAHV